MFWTKKGNNKISDDKTDDSITSSSATSAPCSTNWLLVSLFWNERERERHHGYTGPPGDHLIHNIMQHLKLTPDRPQANIHSGNRTQLDIYVHRNPFGIHVNRHTHTYTHSPVQFSPGPYCNVCSRPLSVFSEPLSPLRWIHFARVCPCHIHTAFIHKTRNTRAHTHTRRGKQRRSRWVSEKL